MKIENEEITCELINKRTKDAKIKLEENVFDSSLNNGSECDACFFVTPKNKRIGGRAMTNSNCGCCFTDLKFTSTNIDVACKSCAIKFKICSHCGSDRHLKDRICAI